MMFLSDAQNPPVEMTPSCQIACDPIVKKERGFAMWRGMLFGAFISSVVWYVKSR